MAKPGRMHAATSQQDTIEIGNLRLKSSLEGCKSERDPAGHVERRWMFSVVFGEAVPLMNAGRLIQ